jgi:hypothetical protein
MANEVNPTKNYIPQIDYVSRDYTAILTDLTAIAKQFNPTWSVSDPTDIGVALLETFAYLGDILSFYTDRMASEGFLGTASQRASVLQIASMLGYTPTPSSAASVSLTLTNNNTSGTLIIPAGTQVASTTVVDGQSTQVIFELDSAVSVAFGATVSATATQGVTTTDEALGVSNGTPGQVFKIAQPGVVINSSGSNITVKVGGVQYTYSSSLVDNNPYDSAFTTTMDADGYTYIVFGDGVGGRIPPASYAITATYRVGVGSAGNIAANSLAKNTLTGSYNVTIAQVGTGTGGADQESTDSIRVNAPRALRTLRRAVSLKDYAYLALQVSGVSKSSADSSVWSNVNLYIAPFNSSAVNTYGPFTNITSIVETAIDSTAGTGYLTYTVANTNIVANQSYVTVSGCAVATYNITTPTLVTFANTTKFTVVKPTSITFLPRVSITPGAGLGGTTASVSATGGDTTGFNTLKSNVVNYFVDKVAPNVTLTVGSPTYVPVNLDLTLHVLPQYNQDAVATQVQNALSNLVSYNNAFFADRIPPHFILNSITNIDGVDYATVDHLRRVANEQIYWTRFYTRTVGTATLTFPNVHNIIAGQIVVVSGVANFDGTYAVNSVTSNTITITVPTGTATPTGVVTSASSPALGTTINITTPASVGIVTGMYVTGTNVPSDTIGNPTVVTNVNNGANTITIANNIGAVAIAGGTALSFSWPTTLTANTTSVTTIDSTTSANITTYGIVCAANEIPTKGTFTITATGGLQ